MNVCFKKRSVYLELLKTRILNSLPFYIIMTSLTFVFHLSKIIIFTEAHIWAKLELENQAGPFVLPSLMSVQRGE